MSTAQSTPPTAAGRSLHRRRVGGWALLAIPAVAFLAVFFAYPTLDLMGQAFTSFVAPQSHGLDNFAWFFSSDLNRTVLVRTIWTSLLVTAVCVLVGYPYAYLMTQVGPRLRLLLLGIVTASFLSSLLVRSFAWVVLVQPKGPINNLLGTFGLGPVHLSGSTAAVVLAMAQIMVPMLILPVFTNLMAMDRRLPLAARSLGAHPATAFLRIVLPLSIPGVAAGCLMVFALTLGFYVTPTLVGSPQNALLSQLVVTQVSQLLAFGRAGALAIILLVLVLIVLGAVAWLARRWTAGTSFGGAQTGAELTSWSKARIAVWTLFALVAVAWLIVPSAIVVPISFSERASFAWPPKLFSTQWYDQLFTDSVWTTAIWNTIRIGALTVVASVALGTPAALALVRSRARWTSALNGLFLAPIIVPVVVTGIGLYSLVLRWHLVGTTTGFVVAHTALALPFVIITIVAGLRTFDIRLEDAAASLGAGPVDVFFSVTLPVIRPALVSAAFIAFVISFDETALSIFVSTTRMQTLPVAIYNGITRQTNPTVAAASTVALVVTLIGLLLAFLVQHRQSRRVFA